MLQANDLAIFDLHRPAEGVVVLDGSVEFSVTGLRQQLAVSVVAFDLVLAEEDPVGE